MSQQPNQGPVRAQGKLPGGVALVVAAGFIFVGLAAWIVSAVASNSQKVEDITTQSPAMTTESYMRELGSQWAEGYINGTGLERGDAAVNLYAKCVIEAQTNVAERFGREESQAWLIGCLSAPRGTIEVPTNTTA